MLRLVFTQLVLHSFSRLSDSCLAPKHNWGFVGRAELLIVLDMCVELINFTCFRSSRLLSMLFKIVSHARQLVAVVSIVIGNIRALFNRMQSLLTLVLDN